MSFLKQASNFMIFPVIIMMQYIDLKDPTTFMAAVVSYAVSTVLCFLVYGYIYFKISQAADRTRIVIPPTQVPFSTANPEPPRESTVEEYDKEELTKALRQVALGFAITAGIVYKFELVQPLVIQTFMNPKTALTHPLAQIYLFGSAPEGALSRPFVPENPLQNILNLVGGQQPAQDVPPPAPIENAPAASKQEGKKKKKKD